VFRWVRGVQIVAGLAALRCDVRGNADANAGIHEWCNSSFIMLRKAQVGFQSTRLRQGGWCDRASIEANFFPTVVLLGSGNHSYRLLKHEGGGTLQERRQELFVLFKNVGKLSLDLTVEFVSQQLQAKLQPQTPFQVTPPSVSEYMLSGYLAGRATAMGSPPLLSSAHVVALPAFSFQLKVAPPPPFQMAAS